VVAKQLFIPMKKYEWYSCPFNKKKERKKGEDV